MRIVRADLELLAERWREHGFELVQPLGEPGASREAIARLSARWALPATLRAFYDELGFVSFVEEPPGGDWPGLEQLDPIQVLALDDQVDRLLASDEPDLLLFDDPLIKFDLSGVGPMHTPLGARAGFDAVLWFEGEPWQPSGGKPRTFLDYLRWSILEGGGIGPAGSMEPPPRKLVKALTAGLTPF